jgi:hypothetical protein
MNWKNPVHLLAAFVLAVLVISLMVFLVRLATYEHAITPAPAPSFSSPSCFGALPSGGQPWGSAGAGC